MESGRSDRAELERYYEQRGYRQPHTLGDLLRDWAGQYGEAIALVEGESRLSFAEVSERADRLAAGLLRTGIAPGDRVLLQLPNSAAFAITAFALFRIGAWPIMAMPAHREKDIVGLCQVAEPVACIMPRKFLGFDYLTLAESVKRDCPSVKQILVSGDAGPWTPLEQLEEAPRDLPSPVATDTALLLLSGGTTGTPKLIPRTHADYAYVARTSARLCGLSAESVYLAALPIAHNFPLCCPGLLGTWGVGGRVVMAQTPSSDEAFELIAAERVSVTALVPPLVKLWLEGRVWDPADLSSLQLLQVGGSRLEADLARRVEPELGCRLQQVFGMAEGLLCYTRLNDPAEVVLATQGRPLCADDEVRIVDAAGQPVADGEQGELQVRGPYTIRGYYRADAHNARTFTPDGFYMSGDLVRRTPDGNLVVEGRVKEQINRAGEKIAAAEIEKVLEEHPGVEGCALVAVADERLGERACAVLLEGERTPTLAEIHRFLGELGLARFKFPDQLLTVPAWPLTTVGKIDKKRLAMLAQADWTDPVAAVLPEPCGYAETRMAVTHAPMDLLLRLLRAEDTSKHALYEQPGEWSLGLGEMIAIGADHEHAWLERDGERQTFRRGRLVEAITAATEAIPVQDWRAYGVAHFELAEVFHHLPSRRPGEPLLELFVPRCEVRIRQGEALLRAIDPADLVRLRALLEQADALDADPLPDPISESLFSRIDSYEQEHYKSIVAGAVEEINAGEYRKVILSRRIPLPIDIDLIESYRVGRVNNTPARSFLIGIDAMHMAGFSPETVVEVSPEGWVSTQPLAGTRASGESREEHERLRAELYDDAKEVAEHAVSVRLAQDEMSGICREFSVTDFMSVLRRGRVQHLASRLGGWLADGRNAWDAFEALFPAVTASSIPKHAGIAAIQRYETRPRGWYSGCAMIIDSRGFLDAALVLRTIYQCEGESWLQAGAGLVGQSRPERELQETREKLGCVLRYLVERTPQQDQIREAS